MMMRVCFLLLASALFLGLAYAQCVPTCGPNAQCSGTTCTCGARYRDCRNRDGDNNDGTGTNAVYGCEVDTNEAPNNCGACTTRCPQNTKCVLGSCSFQCQGGWFRDCANADGDGNPNTGSNPASGCQTDTRIDDNTKCGVTCTVCGTNTACTSRVCACTGASLDCDNSDGDNNPNTGGATGCEVDSNTDNSNCGSCGHQCGPHSTCSGGQCVCDANYGDCFDLDGDGDPTIGNAAGGCSKHLLFSDSHCGTCGNKCARYTVCNNGVCAGCITGSGTNYADCDLDYDNDPQTGGCTDLNKNNMYCGSCTGANRVCGRNSFCSSGTCTCNATPGTDFRNCEPVGAPVMSAGCVDVLKSGTHCGACNSPCPNRQRCVNGACQ